MDNLLRNVRGSQGKTAPHRPSQQEYSAGAVVFYRNHKTKQTEYLVLKYDAGHWDLPKGHVESQETLTQTMRREVREETGIKKIRIISDFQKSIGYSFRAYASGTHGHSKTAPKNNKAPKRGKNFIHKTVTFFVGQAYTKSVKLSFEHSEYQWLSYQKAMRLITYKLARKVLKDAHDFLQTRYAIARPDVGRKSPTQSYVASTNKKK